MNLHNLHFAYPLWLFGMFMIPLVWALFFLFYQKYNRSHQLKEFIDPHLLPYLLVEQQPKKRFFWKSLLLWSIVWTSLICALAGPRLNFREIETFSKDQSLVVLLDLSESMNATDVKPSRLIRAKQKIEDLILLSKGVKMGLIAFAADPHMIAPLTDDKETIRHLLPSLGTDLVYVQGSRLSSALEMASRMLDAEPGNNKALLLITDGGFEDATALSSAREIAEKGVVIHVMGIGSTDGSVLKDAQGNVVKKNALPILSKLEKQKLHEVSEIGKGHYLEGHYSDYDEVLILKDLENRSKVEEKIGKKSKIWDERFYLFLLPILPVILFWFRKEALFCFILSVFLLPFVDVRSEGVRDYFKNSEELGKEAMEKSDFAGAIQKFKDPYRKGVAYYKAGQFAEAEKMFLESSRKEVSLNASYNLGNSLVLQEKFKEAIAAYEEVLKKWPDHHKTKENLELVKSMMQESNSSDSEKSDSKEKKEEKNSEQNEEKRDKDLDESDSDSDQGKDESEKDTDPKEEAPQDPEENNEESSEKDLNEASAEDDPKEKDEKSEEDQDADIWLNRISNDPKPFLKNKFYIESKKNGTMQGVDPW